MLAIAAAPATVVTAPAIPKGVVWEDSSMRVLVPTETLASQSVCIGTSTPKNFATWDADQHKKSYQYLQRVAQIWARQGTESFLVFGKEREQTSFQWEAVPYPKTGSQLWQQLQVLYHISFGGASQSDGTREQMAEALRKSVPGPTAQVPQPSNSNPNACAFCKQEVIDKQKVMEGDKVRVLYNYAPIVFGKDKLHFLIVPKQHRKDFGAVEESEYVEASTLAQKLIRHYKSKGISTAFVFHKTGTRAGQTVPHWHMHVVLTANKTQEVFGKLTVLKNMFFGPSVLPAAELKERVSALQKELEIPLRS